MKEETKRPFKLALVGKSSPFGEKVFYPQAVGKVHPEAGLRMSCAFNVLGELMELLEQMKPRPDMDEGYLDCMRALFDRVMLATVFLIAPTKQKVDDLVKDVVNGTAFNNYMQRA